jgi:hypothetical protein
LSVERCRGERDVMSGETFAGNGSGNFLQWEVGGGGKHIKSPTPNFAALPPESGLSCDLKGISSILVDNSVDPTRACILDLLNWEFN